MKRGEGPKRDPETQRKWERRTRERALERQDRARQKEQADPAVKAAYDAELRRRGRAAAVRRAARKAQAQAEGPLSRDEYRRAAFTAAAGRCTVTARVARAVGDRRFAVHHPLPKRELRGRRLYGSVWDARNALWVWKRAHENHEAGTVRIPREALPASVWEFCAEMDRLGPVGSQWATALVERYHPSGGDLPQQTRR